MEDLSWGGGDENEIPIGRSFPLNITAVFALGPRASASLQLRGSRTPCLPFRRAHLLKFSLVKEEEACILLVASFCSLEPSG